MLVKVWNRNVHPFKQQLGETKYQIGAGEYVELDEDEADRLVKAFSPIRVDYDGNAKAESFKMLEIDKDDLARNRSKRDNKGKTGTYICQACGYVAANKWELNGHSMEMHADSFEDEDEAKAAIASDEKPKRGRPRKEA